MKKQYEKPAAAWVSFALLDEVMVTGGAAGNAGVTSIGASGGSEIIGGSGGTRNAVETEGTRSYQMDSPETFDSVDP